MAVAAPVWSVEIVSPKEIVIDRALNPRLGVDKETVEHYVEVFDQLPPIEAFDTERGRVLVDGWHRLAAAKALGKERIQARVRAGSYLEAKEYAALANLRHGKPLTRDERRNVVETLLLLHAERIDTWLAADAGCSSHFVGERRRVLEAGGLIDQINSRQRPDGSWTEVGERGRRSKPDPWAGALLAGDAFRRLEEVDNASVDLICTDPPYGILGEQGQEWDAFGEPPATYAGDAEDWTELPLEQRLMGFTRCWLEAALPKLKPTGRLFVCFSQVHLHRLRFVLDELAEQGEFDLLYSNTLIWHYKNILAQPNNRSELKLSHEPILHYRARHAPALDFSVYGEEQGDVWTIATPQSNFSEGKDHPAQKPVELMRRIISLACPADGMVLDPFAGSGTTGVAAFGLGRAFRLIERKPEYVAVARRRLDEARRTAERPAELLDAAGD